MSVTGRKLDARALDASAPESPTPSQHAAPDPASITVVMPCRNEERHIAMALRRVLDQEGADTRFKLEVLLVDGRSIDRTREIVAEEFGDDDRLRVVDNPRQITPAAFNLGIQAARGRYICILGAHAEIADDYLLRCFETIEARQVDNVGGPWRAQGRGYTGEAIALAFQSQFAVGGARSHTLSYEGLVDSVWGGFYRREVFDRIGHFDEQLVRNQDDELNLRLVRSGGTVWQSTSIRYTYHCRDSLRGLFRQYRQYGYWKVRVIQKHRLPTSVRHLVPGTFVLGLGALSVAAPFSSVARISWLTLAGGYASAAVLASAWACRSHGDRKYFPIMPFVFGAYHFGYGLGFLEGGIDFLLLKRTPTTSFTELTRS